jgi:thioesterase domain-containing protein
LVLRAERLRFELRAARDRGIDPWQYMTSKLAARKEARSERRRLLKERAIVSQEGFKERNAAQNEILLQATIDTFREYGPRRYSGHLTLFVSDDEELRGVGRARDPRYAWRSMTSSHEIWDFPGGHEAIGELPHAAHFAERLKEALDAALERCSQAGQLIGPRER